MHKVYSLAIVISLLTACSSTRHVEKKVEAAATATTAATDTNKPVQIINLPVFIPVAQLQKQLYTLYFEPHYGKFYPCEGHTDCSDVYKDLYLEKPVLQVKDDYVTIQMHVGGNANAILFHPEVSGDITLTAKPVVKNDTLFFQDVKMEKSSQNFLMGIASALFEKRIVSKIQESAWYSFRPTLDKYTTDFQKQLPFKWESSVLLLNLKRIYLNKVSTIAIPVQGILADFSAEMTLENAAFGQ